MPQIFVALKIKAPEVEEEGLEEAPKTSEPVLVEDVHKWKAGLRVSQGILPMSDIKDYMEFESKL